MKKAVVLILSTVALIFLYQSYWPGKAESKEETYYLRNAMQERLQEMLKLKAEIEQGKTPTKNELHKFAGLPNSEFVDDVSEYQDTFKSFDAMYDTLLQANINDQITLKKEYNMIVQTCASCHKTVCPGPLRSIKKLEIDI